MMSFIESGLTLLASVDFPSWVVDLKDHPAFETTAEQRAAGRIGMMVVIGLAVMILFSLFKAMTAGSKPAKATGGLPCGEAFAQLISRVCQERNVPNVHFSVITRLRDIVGGRAAVSIPPNGY